MKRSFKVDAIWDETDGIWYSESDIVGLHIEAETMEEFENLVKEFAADLIGFNHLAGQDLNQVAKEDLITPIVITQRPSPSQVA